MSNLSDVLIPTADSTNDAHVLPPLPTPPSPPPSRSKLPSEVIQTIILFTLPPPSSTRRQHLLALYSLVSPSWRLVAQPLLFKHVRLTRKSTTYKFLQVTWSMETSRAKTLARNHTVSLRIGFEGPLGTNGLEDNLKDQHQMVDFVLRSCPSIKDLWIRDLVIDPAVLSFAVELETLTITSTTLKHLKPTTLSPDTWHFPHLRTLHLDTVYVLIATSTTSTPSPFTSSLLLSSLSLPSLTTLTTIFSHPAYTPQFPHLAKQLTTLLIARRGYRDPPQSNRYLYPALPLNQINLCSSKLKHLSIDVKFMNEPDGLNDLSRRLRVRTLRLDTSAPLVVLERLLERVKEVEEDLENGFVVESSDDGEVEDEEGSSSGGEEGGATGGGGRVRATAFDSLEYVYVPRLVEEEHSGEGGVVTKAQIQQELEERECVMVEIEWAQPSETVTKSWVQQCRKLDEMTKQEIKMVGVQETGLTPAMRDASIMEVQSNA